MVSAGRQLRSKLAVTAGFRAFECHVNIWFWKDYSNSHWLGRYRFSSRVRTRYWCDVPQKKFKALFPSFWWGTDQQWLRDEWWPCLHRLQEAIERRLSAKHCMSASVIFHSSRVAPLRLLWSRLIENFSQSNAHCRFTNSLHKVRNLNQSVVLSQSLWIYSVRISEFNVNV